MRPDLGQLDLRDDEGLAVGSVEPQGEIAGELDVLALVVADGDAVGVVEEDVGRHQGGIGEKAGAHGGLAAGLLLELRHPSQLAVRGGALEEPRELGVLGDVALQEDRAQPGVEPDGEQAGGRLEGLDPQLLGWGRAHAAEGVEVDDAEHGLVGPLSFNPLAEGADVVAEVERAGGLHTGEDPCHGKNLVAKARSDGPFTLREVGDGSVQRWPTKSISTCSTGRSPCCCS